MLKAIAQPFLRGSAHRRCLALWLILVPCVKCNNPGDKPTRPSIAKSDSTRRSANQAAPGRPSNGKTVQRMCIGAECVNASEMWQSLGERILEELKALPPEQRRAHIERLAAQWITDRIAESVLYQQAALRLPEQAGDQINDYVNGELRKIITAEHGGIQRRYEKHLASKGQTLDDARDKLRREILVAGYLEREIKPRIAEPTRSELLAVYHDNVDSWRRPSRRRMSLIDVRVLDRLPDGVDEPTREQLAEARDAARAVIEPALLALEAGEPFEEVARRYSDGLHAPEGGSWGWVTPESVRPRFAPAVEALYRLNAGQISEPIDTEDGIFLVRCDEIDAGFEPTFADVQPELMERYVQAAYNHLIADHVTELREKTHIEPENLGAFHAAVVEAARVQTSLADVSVP